jgi:hypothetical protein
MLNNNYASSQTCIDYLACRHPLKQNVVAIKTQTIDNQLENYLTNPKGRI